MEVSVILRRSRTEFSYSNRVRRRKGVAGTSGSEQDAIPLELELDALELELDEELELELELEFEEEPPAPSPPQPEKTQARNRRKVDLNKPHWRGMDSLHSGLKRACAPERCVTLYLLFASICLLRLKTMMIELFIHLMI